MVNVRDPKFVSLDRRDSTVRDAWYAVEDQYMVIMLGETNYHYCGMPTSAWSAFIGADDVYGHYETNIRGRFDCRLNWVPPSTPRPR